MSLHRDRKVAQILELIHQGNLREAMRKCNNKIQKTERAKFYALKALVLQKFKKIDECTEIVSSIRYLAPQEFEVAEILVTIYKNLKKFNEVTALYEETYQKFPTEERGKKLYHAYSNQFKLAEQSKLALSLHRNYRKLEYAEMAVLAMLTLSDLEDVHSGMIEIADLLFKKIKRDEFFEYTENFFRLDLQIKLRLAAHSEVIHMLVNNPGMIPDSVERMHKLARQYKSHQKYYDALNTYHAILVLNLNEHTARDMWDIYMDYLETIFEIIANAKEGITAFNLSHIIDPFTYSIKALDSGQKIHLWKEFLGNETVGGVVLASLANIRGTRDIISGRAPIVEVVKKHSFLAEFEYKRRLIYCNFSQGSEEYKEENDTGAIFMTLLYKYITLYYEVESTPDDLVPYLPLLNSSQCHPFRTRLDLFLKKLLEISANRLKCLRCALCTQKIYRLIGLYSYPHVRSIADQWECAFTFINYYLEYSQFEAAPRKGEVKLVDEFLLLAVEILMQTPYTESPKSPTPSLGLACEEEQHPSLSQRVFYCISLLSQGLEQSPFNNYLKFKLMQLHELSGNIMNVEHLFQSLELKPQVLEKQCYLFFRSVSERRIHPQKLVETCEDIKIHHQTHHSELVPFIQRAYSQHNIEELKLLLREKENAEKSYYLVLVQYEMLNFSFVKNAHLPGPQLSRLLREGLSFMNFAAKLPPLSHFSLTPEPTSQYYCGSLTIKSMRDVRLRTPYNTEELLSQDPYSFRKLLSPEECYGAFSDHRYIRLEALKLKLVLDVLERNVPGIDSGIRAFHIELLDLELLAKPTLAKGLSNKDNHPPSGEMNAEHTSEDAEELQQFNGKFNSETEFCEHAKKVEEHCWKFILMLFEGAYRLGYAHPLAGLTEKRGKDPVKVSEVADTELSFRLTSYPHIIRQFEILSLMLRDIETSIVPKEDYLKKLKLGLSDIINSMELGPEETEFAGTNEIIYPGMIVVIGKFILGPLTVGSVLVNSYAQLMPSKQEQNSDLTALIQLTRAVQAFNAQLKVTIDRVKIYLLEQKKVCFSEKLFKQHLKNQNFQRYSSVLSPKVFQEVVQSMRKNKDEEVSACLNLISTIERIPPPVFNSI